MDEEVKLPEELRDILADAKVMCRIGQAYLEGYCLKRDSLRGVYWLRQAANMDCPDAIETLAVCYEKGTGVIANAAIAAKLHARAQRLVEAGK